MFLVGVCIFVGVTLMLAITEPLENVLFFLFLTGVIVFAGSVIPAIYAALGIGAGVGAAKLAGAVAAGIGGVVWLLTVGGWLFALGIVLVLAPYLLWLVAEVLLWLLVLAFDIGGGFLILVLALLQGIGALIMAILPIVPYILGLGALFIGGSMIWVTVGPAIIMVLGFVYVVLASIITGILYIVGVMVVAAEWLIWLSQFWYLFVGSIAGVVFWRPVIKLAFWVLYVAIRLLKPLLDAWAVVGLFVKFLLECLAAAYDFGKPEKHATTKAKALFGADVRGVALA